MIKFLTSFKLFKFFFIIILSIVVLGNIIKVLFHIYPGSPLALYRDVIIITFFLFSICTMLVRPMNIIRNILDALFFIFLLFGVYEIIWTWYLTNDLFIGIFRFRLYFLVYLMYFVFVYFFRQRLILIKDSLKSIKKLFLISFIWAVLEFMLLNTHVISADAMSSFWGLAVPGSGSANYSNLGDKVTLFRGYGIIGHMQLAGVFSAIGLAMFWPLMHRMKNLRARIFITLGILATLLPLGKTAWVLLFFAVLLLFLGYRGEKGYYAVLMLTLFSGVTFLLIKFEHIKDTVDANMIQLFSVYLPSLNDFVGQSLWVYLFGFGYEVHSGEIEVFEIGRGSEFTLTVGSEFFFFSLARQWGIVGFFLYLLIFFIIPLRIFFVCRDLTIKGFALAVVIAGISSIHYNAIFSNGVNIIVCFLLSCLSVFYFDRKDIKPYVEV